MKAQESFQHDPEVQVLLATDAAGEGINLQRAHLMVNYDLPWNPNRLEQRFGRIHRIGQTEVCHLWNLVAEETREGDVYRKLLEKLEEARAGARRPGLRRARQAPVRGQVAARSADRGHPLRRPARGARPSHDGAWSRRSTAASSRTCSKTARWPTTRWTPAASSASARTWSAPRPAASSRTTSSRSSSKPSSAWAAPPSSASRAATRSPTFRRRSATATA